MLFLILAGGAAALLFMKNAINFPLVSSNTLWQAVDPRRYMPGLLDGEVRDKRSRVGQPYHNIRNPHGPSNVFQKNIEYIPPFVKKQYSVAYARNYSNVGADLRTQDWRLDPNFAGVKNNYSGYYVPEDIVGSISKHHRAREEDRWRPRK